MVGFLDVCRFNPTAGGTTDWTYSSAVQGYQSPSAANAVNGTVYRYRAESSDLSQWEIGYGAWTSSTGVLARTTVLFNSSGNTSKISFSAAPQVAIVALAEDLIPALPTKQVFASGSGTYTTPAGALWLRVRMVGGGGGGGGGSTSGGGGSGGSPTTFGTSLLTANGGAAGGPGGNGGATGGSASGGHINLSGGDGQASYGAGGGTSTYLGGMGGNSVFGGGGYGGWASGGSGAAGVVNTGGGGGGGGGTGSSNNDGGSGGAAGGYCEAIITNPSATYAYAVGAGGTAGLAGASGSAAGGAGGSGLLIVEEFYR